MNQPRGFSNQESRLLSQSHTFAIIVILDLTPYLLRLYVKSTQGSSSPSHVWLYPRIIVTNSHENTSKYVDTVTFFQKKNKKKILINKLKVIDP